MPLLPPSPPTSKLMDFLLSLYQKGFKQNCEFQHSTKIANKLSQNLRTNRIMTKIEHFIRKTMCIRQRIPSQRLIRKFLFEIWCLTFASELSGRVRIRIRLRNCIDATAAHSAPTRVGPDVGLAPSAAWTALPLHPPAP